MNQKQKEFLVGLAAMFWGLIGFSLLMLSVFDRPPYICSVVFVIYLVLTAILKFISLGYEK